MATFPFKGVFTALVTPFRDGAVDEAALAALVDRQVAAGVHGLVAVGTTGESATLSHEEQGAVIALTVEAAAGRVPVIAGAGSYATAEAIALTGQAKAAGAAAALVVTPYYNRPSQEGLYLHFAAIAAACDLPIIVYNVPSRTSIDIANETLARLAKLSTVIGIKDATGDMSRPSLQRLACGPDWGLFSGDDPSALGYMAHGGHGCISVTANVAPKPCAQFFDFCLSGRWSEALALQERLIRLHKALFLDASPAPTKFALAHLGLIAGEARLPIAPCAEAVKDEILAAMAEAGAT
ncbi:MAG TPA: 4-hydroxy-tetrahydrodipicolinate synthase [Caulobacteraceae bacterium]|nr:4-hydroxy-tetrahydrodipicolinate synthase [Caulobacteraceae bacterium]